MTKLNLNAKDIDTWQSERNLDRMRAPARHVVGAWALAGALALGAVLGPPATRQAVSGLVALRQDVLTLDHELDHELERVLVRLAGKNQRASLGDRDRSS